MTPNYTRTGLDAYRAAVPLPVPLPPGEPDSWTCLYALLGGRLAFLRESYLDVAPESLLRELLELSGRPCAADESRLLLLVTPMPSTVSLHDLLVRALRGRHNSEAARLLGYLGDSRAVPVLLQHAADPDMSLRQAAILALGQLGAGADRIAKWDGDYDADRFLALVKMGVLPDELPTGELEPLAGWIPSLDATAGREVLSSLDGFQESLVLAVGHVLARHPDAATELAEPLVEQLSRACDHPVWAEAIAASGEEGLELVIEQLSADDWRARMGAAIVLGHVSDAKQTVVPALRKALMDDDSDVRREAALALVSQGTGASDARIAEWTVDYGFLDRAGAHPWAAALAGGPVPLDLFALLARRDGGEVLTRAALALAFAHPDLAAPALDALARDHGFDVPLEARQAAAAGLLATGAVPTGATALHRVLLRGVGSGGTTGPLTDLVAEDLAALAGRDADWQIRHAALGFLERTGEAHRFHGLLTMLEASDSDSDVRERARSMQGGGYRPTGVGVALADLVVSSRADSERRARALDDLAQRDPALAGTLAAALLDHTDRGIAVLAGRLAGSLCAASEAEGRAKRALGQLRVHDWIKREAAAALLGALDPSGLDADFFEELVETLEATSTDDDDSDVQRMAAWAVAELRGKRT